MNHDKHHDMHMHDQGTGSPIEYVKFIVVIAFVFGVATLLASIDFRPFMESLMGVFLLVFGGFKLINLREFAYGFQSYDIVAKKSLQYSFAYPFIQIGLGAAYLAGLASLLLHVLALIVAVVASVGVLQTLLSGQKVHCVCLGNVIRLPLSRISFVEDFGMALMAIAMIFMR